jgi:hypothetical protein
VRGHPDRSATPLGPGASDPALLGEACGIRKLECDKGRVTRVLSLALGAERPGKTQAKGRGRALRCRNLFESAMVRGFCDSLLGRKTRPRGAYPAQPAAASRPTPLFLFARLRLSSRRGFTVSIAGLGAQATHRVDGGPPLQLAILAESRRNGPLDRRSAR